MYKLNHIQFPSVKQVTFDATHALEALKDNSAFESLKNDFASYYGFSFLNTFSFSEDGFVSIMMKLEGNIAVSVGESEAIVKAALQCEKYGKKITFIPLNQDGTLNSSNLDETIDVIFVSSYIMDTFVKVDLCKIKQQTNAQLISNVSASLSYMECIDVALFDSYKLTGFQTHSIALHNGLLPEQFLSQYDVMAISMINQIMQEKQEHITIKETFSKVLQEAFEEDLFFFVKNEQTLENTLHLGLKNIKAREIIRTLALSSIFITNGEGCSLGLSRPSRIIQAMGYSEEESRQAISLSFTQNLTVDQMQKIAATMAKKYRQIRRLNA